MQKLLMKSLKHEYKYALYLVPFPRKRAPEHIFMSDLFYIFYLYTTVNVACRGLNFHRIVWIS